MARDQQDGYIMIDRGIVESEIWNKPPLYIKVWLLLIIKAQHAGYKGLRRGQLRITIDEIREACAWKVGWRKEKPTKKQIWDILEWLRNPQEGNDGGNHGGSMVVTTKGTHGMLVTLCNYNVYQDPKRYEGNNGGTAEVTTTELRRSQQGNNTNKNDKNDKNARKNNPYSPLLKDCPQDLVPAMEEFMEYRKSIKKPMSELAVKKTLTRLQSLSGGDIGLSKAILDQSIVNGWTGIFPLKDDRRNTKPQQNTLMHMLEEGRFDE